MSEVVLGKLGIGLLLMPNNGSMGWPLTATCELKTRA